MKAIKTVLYCIGLGCAALPAAQAQSVSASMVHAPAGDLGDAVESLAKQGGLNVMYAGDLLDGKKTAGVDGIYTPRDALSRLLEGTSLVVTEERGAIRIANAASPGPGATVAPIAATAHSNVSIPTVWKRRELRIPCRGCDLGTAMKDMLRQLGATEVMARPRNATFLSLAPADNANDAKEQSQLTMHWETVTFGLEGSLPRDGAIEISPVLFGNLRTRILPLFTTRALAEESDRITLDVLVPGGGPGAAECHRVTQGGAIHRYCGSGEQWRDLQARVGFTCRPLGSRGQLCASAKEWKRVDLTESTRRSLTAINSDEAVRSVEQNHPSYTVTPSVSAPLTPVPAPAPMN